MNKSPITDDERKRRQQSIDFARTNIELSGFKLSPKIEALNARYIAGEITSHEHTEAIIALPDLFPTTETAQRYFSSLEELKAHYPDGRKGGGNGS